MFDLSRFPQARWDSGSVKMPGDLLWKRGGLSELIRRHHSMNRCIFLHETDLLTLCSFIITGLLSSSHIIRSAYTSPMMISAANSSR